jgi:hypothetical protein
MWRAVWDDYEFDAPLLPRMGERKSYRCLLTKFLPGPWRNRDGGPMVSIAWASLNAFGARLHAQTDLALLDVRALFALMEALEDDRSTRALDDVVPAAACKLTIEPFTSYQKRCRASQNSFSAFLHQEYLENVLALVILLFFEPFKKSTANREFSAGWILYAGKKIKENYAAYETDHDDATSTNRLRNKGALYNGPRGFSEERWGFWKTRFGTLAERMDLKRNTRIYAKQAMNEMQRLDSAQSTSTLNLGQQSQQRTFLPVEVVGQKRQMGPTLGESSRAPSRRVLVSDLIN